MYASCQQVHSAGEEEFGQSNTNRSTDSPVCTQGQDKGTVYSCFICVWGTFFYMLPQYNVVRIYRNMTYHPTICCKTITDPVLKGSHACGRLVPQQPLCGTWLFVEMHKHSSAWNFLMNLNILHLVLTWEEELHISGEEEAPVQWCMVHRVVVWLCLCPGPGEVGRGDSVQSDSSGYADEEVSPSSDRHARWHKNTELHHSIFTHLHGGLEFCMTRDLCVRMTWSHVKLSEDLHWRNQVFPSTHPQYNCK